MKNSLSKLKILTPNGFRKFSGIRRKEAECLKIMFVDNAVSPITVSHDHTFIVDDVSTIVSDLKDGDFLTHKKYGKVEIAQIDHLGVQDVYDPVEVEDGNVYYSEDIVSHNCSFIGSTATLISAEYLEMMVISEPVAVKYGSMLKIYKVPEKGTKYVLGIDVAEGVGGDSSVIQVLSVDKNKRMEQVAVYSCNTIKPYDFAQVCIGVSDYYNEAEMLIENNNIGGVLLTTIWYDYDVDRIINTDTKKGRRELGIRASTRTKSIGTANLKRCIENGWLIVVDSATINELGQFEEVRPGIFKASSETGHDDHVMSLLWGAYFIESGMFDETATESKKELDEEYVLVSAVVDDDQMWNDPTPGYINPWEYEDSEHYQTTSQGQNFDYQGYYTEYQNSIQHGQYNNAYDTSQFEQNIRNSQYNDFFS